MFGPISLFVIRALLTRTLQNIKEGIEGHAVDWYNDVFDLVFPDVKKDEVNNRWKSALKEKESDKKSRKSKEKDEENDSDSDDD